ncbi:hypothetical protein RW64_17350 [Geobacter sulfurreducens]|nr:hypothetical protein RW64_17350 [Geobacter sulfurreducens]
MKKFVTSLVVLTAMIVSAQQVTASGYDSRVERKVEELIKKDETYNKLLLITAIAAQLGDKVQLAKAEKNATEYYNARKAEIQAEVEAEELQQVKDTLVKNNQVDAFGNFWADKLGNGNRDNWYEKMRDIISILNDSPTKPGYAAARRQFIGAAEEFKQKLAR